MSQLNDSPSSQHYRQLSPEPIEVTESWNLGFHLGNAMKYLSRHSFKGTPIEDLKKAVWYIKRYALVTFGVDLDNDRKRVEKRIYISGPITGKPEYNINAFEAAERHFEANGFDVINPLKNFDGDKTLKREVYMRKDIELLLTCDAIAMLPNWEESRGAMLENHIAHEIGLQVHYFSN